MRRSRWESHCLGSGSDNPAASVVTSDCHGRTEQDWKFIGNMLRRRAALCIDGAGGQSGETRRFCLWAAARLASNLPVKMHSEIVNMYRRRWRPAENIGRGGRVCVRPGSARLARAG
jgi:hypothetical protein